MRVNLAETLRLELRSSAVDLRLLNTGLVETRLTAKNRFRMPAMVTPQTAARAVVNGLRRERFEISFPFGFVAGLKLLRLLPYRLYFPLVARCIGS